MPRRRPCPEGSSCKYQHHHQHTEEFSHGEESDKLATKAEQAKASAWKKTKGRTLGGVRPQAQAGRNRVSGNRRTGKISRNAVLAAGEAAAKRAVTQPLQQWDRNLNGRRGVTKTSSSQDSGALKRPSKRLKTKEDHRAARDEIQAETGVTSRWTCSVCTLVNDSLADRCSVCNSQRGAAKHPGKGGSSENPIDLE